MQPSSSLAYRPTWRGGRMADTIPCSEFQILSLLETTKQQNDQLVAKVNLLTSRMNSTPGPDVEMPDSIQFPLEQLDTVEAFEQFLKEPSNGPARQRVISSLANIGGQDVKRVTWNILGRLFTDEVSHQINWKGVHNKKPFSRMATKTLLFSAVRKNVVTRSATDAEVTKHAISKNRRDFENKINGSKTDPGQMSQDVYESVAVPRRMSQTDPQRTPSGSQTDPPRRCHAASCYAVHYLHLVATWRRWFLSFHTCVRSAHHQFLLESEISCQPAPVRRYVYTYFPCHRTPACLTTRLPSPCLPVIEPLPVGLSFWFLTPRLF
ncbi:unnamed protein product [Boreogadus saida]